MAPKTAPKVTNRFAGLVDTKVSQTGVNFTPGFEGLVEVKAIKGFDSNKGAGYTIVAELEVIETNTPTHPVGAQRSYVMLYESQMGEQNLLCFMAAATGEQNPADPDFKARMAGDEENPGEVAQALDENENPLEGVQLRLTTFETMTKGDAKRKIEPHPFTVHRWSPIEGSEEAA